jgi:hypothetical protein
MPKIGPVSRLILLMSVAVALVLPGSSAMGQEEVGHVGVVLQFGDGRVLTRYLELPTPVDRLTVLESTGLALETAHGGDAMCKIEEEGCPGNDNECWCQCPFTPGEPCTFWIYFPMNEAGDGWGDMNAWPLPELEDGDVSGWIWGEIDVEASPWVPLVELPFYTIDEIHQRALTGGEVEAVGRPGELTVTATFSGDSDGSGSAALRYRTGDGPWSEPLEMARGDGLFTYTLSDVEPNVDYAVEVNYADYESGVIEGEGPTGLTTGWSQTTVAEAPGLGLVGGVAFVVLLALLLAVYLWRRLRSPTETEQ